MDAKERLKVQETLIHAAETVLRQMRGEAEDGRLDQIGRFAEKLQTLTKQKDFPSPRVEPFQRLAKQIQRDAWEHSVGDMLNQIVHDLHSHHNGDEDKKNALLGKVREHMTMAGRFGADESFRAGVERRLQLIQLTTGEGIDKRAKAEAARKTELRDTICKAPGGKERRRAIRYIDPVLTVEINGHKYPTLNWSVRGLLIGDFGDALALGSDVKVTLTCEGFAGGGRTWAKVARRVPKDHELALAFADISTVILGLMHEMRAQGVHPEPG